MPERAHGGEEREEGDLLLCARHLRVSGSEGVWSAMGGFRRGCGTGEVDFLESEARRSL